MSKVEMCIRARGQLKMIESALEYMFELPKQVVESIEIIDRYLECKIDDFARGSEEDTQEVVVPEGGCNNCNC